MRIGNPTQALPTRRTFDNAHVWDPFPRDFLIANAVAPGANKVHLMPFWVPPGVSMDVDSVLLRVGTGVASSNIRVAIMSISGLVLTKVGSDSGNVASTSNNTTVTATIDALLQGGNEGQFFDLLIAYSSTQSLNGWNTGGTVQSPNNALIARLRGTPVISGTPAVDPSQQRYGLIGDRSFGSIPSSLTLGTDITSVANVAAPFAGAQFKLN